MVQLCTHDTTIFVLLLCLHCLCGSRNKVTKCIQFAESREYSLLKAENVIGLPTDIPLKHPSHLKHDELQAIYIALPSR